MAGLLPRSVPCTIGTHHHLEGVLSFTASSDGGCVKSEPGLPEGVEADSSTALLRPPFVAVWLQSVGPSDAAAPAAAPVPAALRVDLRCDVEAVQVASKPPALAARLTLTPERVAQGQLCPPLATPETRTAVLQFSSTEDRNAFVEAMKFHRLAPEDAAALRAMAAAVGEPPRSTGDPAPPVAAAAAVSAAAAAAVHADVKPSIQGPIAVPKPGTSEVVGEAKHEDQDDKKEALRHAAANARHGLSARERQWMYHDGELRQLFGALVANGVLTEEEFAVAHREEKAAFFASDTTHQRIGATTVRDALSQLVDPTTHELLPITEEVAANVFRQYPALERVYCRRVQSPEDELVFWDAVVRRCLFLARTVVDADLEADDAASSSNTAVSVASPQAAAGKKGGVEAVAQLWMTRSKTALPSSDATTTGGGAPQPMRRGTTDAEAQRQRELHESNAGRHRHEAGDAEASGGLRDKIGEKRAAFAPVLAEYGAVLATARRQSASDGTMNDRRRIADVVLSSAALQRRLESEFDQRATDESASPSVAWDPGHAQDILERLQKSRSIQSAGTTTMRTAEASSTAPSGDANEDLWGGMVRVIVASSSNSAEATRERTSASATSKPPVELRTFHSLHRLYYRHLLAPNRSTTRTEEIYETMGRALTKGRVAIDEALGDTDVSAEDAAVLERAWEAAVRLHRRATEVHRISVTRGPS